MNKKTLYTLFLASTTLLWSGCHDDDYSVDYDLTLPVAKIITASDTEPFVGKNITVDGENLHTATSVSIGAYNFPIVSVNEEGTSMTITVPRAIDAGALTVTNKYKRTHESEVKLVPQYYEAVVTKWPSQIQKGKPFTIEGSNMDLLKEVRINGTALSLSGAAKEGSANYSSVGVDMAVGDFVLIEVTPKNGEKQISPEVEVVKPSDKYIPKSTLMLIDCNATYELTKGDKYSEVTVDDSDKGLFGKALRVSAPVGNGWNGIYCKIYSDNGGQGYDLSSYTNPCITMLINTNGKQGYIQPIMFVNGSEEDRHLESVHGYGDDYKSSTNGWEWRSYSLKDLNFPVSNGFIDKIGVQFRGGNIGNGNEDAFDASLNLVMITDGPLNPTVAWDAETDMASYEVGRFALKNSGSNASLIGTTQGSYYANYNGPSAGWDKSVIGSVTCKALDPDVYSNGIWINFLVNTGSKGGYVQPCMGSGWMNLTKDQGYGDDYQLVPTNNEWQWRSIRVVPGEGDLKGWDSSADFEMKVQILGGNYGGADMDISCDYFVFTTAPMDPKLDTSDFK